MIGVALKGLAGRKIRALLTAFAIVIGVSMVSGTFILTDTMQRTFDGLFTASSAQTDAVIQGKKIVDFSASGAATVPESLLSKVKALPEVGAASGTVAPEASNVADIIDSKGKKVGLESIGTSFDPAGAQFSPLKLKSGQWAQGPEQVVIDAGTAAKEHYAIGDPVGHLIAGEEAHVRGDRHRVVRRHRLARLRHDRGVGPRDGPEAAPPRGPVRHDLDRGQGRHVADRARRRDQAAHDRHAPGQGQRQAGGGGREGAQQRDGLPALRPARLRRDRVVRRCVRDLQHPLDHGRPADA